MSVPSMDAKKIAQAGLDKSLVVQAPLAKKNVERLRRVHPRRDATGFAQEAQHDLPLRGHGLGRRGGGCRRWLPGVGIPAALADTILVH